MSANFSVSDWLNGEEKNVPDLHKEVPQRPDNYRPGHLSWGKNTDRGLAIQRGRGRKQHLANKAFFLESVLPKIESRLNEEAWADIARCLQDDSFYRRGGWVLYRLEDTKQQSWVHPVLQSDKIKAAKAMGAKEVA